jgi:hypothetical protein
LRAVTISISFPSPEQQFLIGWHFNMLFLFGLPWKLILWTSSYHLFSVLLYKVKLSLCLTTPTPLRRMGERMCRPTFSWPRHYRWVVSFTPRPLYPRGKSPRYPLDRRLGGLQSRSGRLGEETILDRTGTRNPTPRLSNL